MTFSISNSAVFNPKRYSLELHNILFAYLPCYPRERHQKLDNSTWKFYSTKCIQKVGVQNRLYDFCRWLVSGDTNPTELANLRFLLCVSRLERGLSGFLWLSLSLVDVLGRPGSSGYRLDVIYNIGEKGRLDSLFDLSTYETVHSWLKYFAYSMVLWAG